MIPVLCRTNLDDVMRYEKWPELLPARPVIGDYIESKKIWNNSNVSNFRLELKVTSCSWKCCLNHTMRFDPGDWYLEVYLDLPPNFQSIAHFHNWYRKTRGVISVEEYIAIDRKLTFGDKK